MLDDGGQSNTAINALFAQTHMLVAKFAQIQYAFHLVQSFRRTAALEAQSRKGIVGIVAHDIAPANLQRIEIQAASNLVHCAFDRETCRYSPYAAIWSHWRFVGRDGVDIPLVG